MKKKMRGGKNSGRNKKRNSPRLAVVIGRKVEKRD